MFSFILVVVELAVFCAFCTVFFLDIKNNKKFLADLKNINAESQRDWDRNIAALRAILPEQEKKDEMH